MVGMQRPLIACCRCRCVRLCIVFTILLRAVNNLIMHLVQRRRFFFFFNILFAVCVCVRATVQRIAKITIENVNWEL